MEDRQAGKGHLFDGINGNHWHGQKVVLNGVAHRISIPIPVTVTNDAPLVFYTIKKQTKNGGTTCKYVNTTLNRRAPRNVRTSISNDVAPSLKPTVNVIVYAYRHDAGYKRCSCNKTAITIATAQVRL